MKKVTEQVAKQLLKKWRTNLTKYNKLKDNNWIVTRKRGNITKIIDKSPIKDWYNNEIQKGEKIIKHCENSDNII